MRIPGGEDRSPDGAQRNPGPPSAHFAEPVLGLAEGKSRGLHAGYLSNPSRNPIMSLDTHFFDDRAETV
jgi:hypothetical protein